MDGWGLLSGSLFEKGYCICSEAAGVPAGWALWLGGTAGWTVHSSGATGWASSSCGASGYVSCSGWAVSSVITAGWVRLQAVFPGRMVPLTGYHDWAVVGCALQPFLVRWGLRVCSLTGWCYWLGSVSGGVTGWASAWWYHGLSSKVIHSPWSGFLVMWCQGLCSTVGQGVWLSSLPRQGHRTGFLAIWVLWPGFLHEQDMRLCLAVGVGCELAFLPGWVGSMVALSPETQIPEVPTEPSGQMGPLAWLCPWALLLTGDSV